VVYVVIASCALTGTWGNNLKLPYLGIVEGTLQFWKATLASPVSRSVTVDLFFLGLAVMVWMVIEARRLAMRGVWLYIVVGIVFAVSVTIPLFLIHRERALARIDRATRAGELGRGDVAGISLIGLGIVAYTLLTLVR
jgi:hypothetical protein